MTATFRQRLDQRSPAAATRVRIHEHERTSVSFQLNDPSCSSSFGDRLSNDNVAVVAAINATNTFVSTSLLSVLVHSQCNCTNPFLFSSSHFYHKRCSHCPCEQWSLQLLRLLQRDNRGFCRRQCTGVVYKSCTSASNSLSIKKPQTFLSASSSTLSAS